MTEYHTYVFISAYFLSGVKETRLIDILELLELAYNQLKFRVGVRLSDYLVMMKSHKKK